MWDLHQSFTWQLLLSLRTVWYEFLVVFFSYWWIQWCLVCCMSGVNSTKIQLSHSGLEPNLRSVFFSQITSNLDLSKMHEYNKNVLLCWEQLLYQQLKQTGTNSFIEYQNFYVKIKSEIWSHVTIVLIWNILSVHVIKFDLIKNIPY